MNKKLLIILVGSVAGIIFVIAIILIFSKKSSNLTPVNPLIQAANYKGAVLKQDQGNSMVWKTTKGDVVSSNIFNKYPLTNTQYGDPEYLTLAKSSEYEIKYVYNGDNININLVGADLVKSRKDAEQQFLSILKISENDACKLSISVTIPQKVSMALGGDDTVDYGLSFCSGAFIYKQTR